MDKFEKDGKIAVLISSGFGAGWSTWSCENRSEMLFCPEMVQAILDGRKGELQEIANRLFPDEYTGGLEDVEIHWVDKGDRFVVREYDGSEELTVIGPDYGYVA